MDGDANSSAWPAVSLSDEQHFKLIMGQSPPGSTYNESGQGLAFFQGKADFGEESPTARVFCSAPSRIAEPGDILISVRAPVGPTNLADRQCAIGRGLAAIRCTEGVAPRYLLMVLRALEADIAHLAEGQGGGFTCLRKQQLADFKIPVPPLAEQRRIVARVEALTRRLDQARQARQAALAEAETLLSSTVSKAQNKFRQAGKSTVLGEILTDLQYGTSAKASVHPVGTPVIRMGNIQNGRIAADNLKYLQLPPVEFERYRLDQGDVLINRTNSAELVGKTGLFDLAGDYVFASYLIRLRVNRSIADPAFVNYAINSDDGLAYLRSQGKDAIGQTNINTKQIRQMPITIPPLPAQRALVARLDALRGKLDELQRLQREVAAELASFTPALLAKAFRGEL